MTDRFAGLARGGRTHLAIMAIGAYDPWIRVHATPEQAVAMANAAGAEYIMPVHHQTFRLSASRFVNRSSASRPLSRKRRSALRCGKSERLSACHEHSAPPQF